MTKSEASKKICSILSEYESATGELIEYIELVKIETTTCSDINRQHLLSVNIESFRPPGHSWSK